MTKRGADVSGKPADPGSVERGVASPVVLQPVPEKVSTRNLNRVPSNTPPNQNTVDIRVFS